MLFKEKLYYILSDLSKHKHSKSETFAIRVQERLDRSLESYSDELDKSLHYLTYRDTINVLKKMNRG